MANEHGLIVTFRSTKTIQFGERQLHIPLLRLPGSPLCPVSAYHRMVRLISASPRFPLFLLLGPRGCTPLTKHRFVTEFRRVLSAAGVADPSSFRGLLALPPGLSITGFRANLFSYTEIGPVTLIRSI